jgi:hypothetical protein
MNPTTRGATQAPEACLTCLALCVPKVGKAPYRSPPPTLSLNKTQRTGLKRPRTHIHKKLGWEGGVHFALDLDGRRRHGADGRRADERERKKACVS